VARCDLVLFEEDVERLNAALDGFLREADAKCVLILGKSGHLISVRGVTEMMDTTSLSALAAGAFASTREIARLVGEPEFSVLFHQGRREHIHVSIVDDETLLMAIFDDRTTIGMVRLYAKQAGEQIAGVFSDIHRQRNRGARLLDDLSHGDDLDTTFPQA